MTALKTTPFYQAHQDAGAKLVDFAGWELPIHYGSQIAEHEAVRTDAGMFDVSHMLVTDVATECQRCRQTRLRRQSPLFSAAQRQRRRDRRLDRLPHQRSRNPIPHRL